MRHLAFAFAFAACTSSNPAGPDHADPRAPVFLSFGGTGSTVFENKHLTITAVVTDPDGIDDVVGGTLVDPDSGTPYGAFATAAQEGAYQIDLQWWDLDAVAPIDAPAMIGTKRTVRAEMFDQEGHAATRDLTITLRCSDDHEKAVAGHCVSNQSFTTSCNPEHTSCVVEVTDGAPGSITGDTMCSSIGMQCSDCYATAGGGFPVSCSTALQPLGNCTCRDN